MANELRKNPRFLAAEGVPAHIVDAGNQAGTPLAAKLHNFSSTGFAVVLPSTPAGFTPASLEVRFNAQAEGPEILISARVINQITLPSSETRLGCQIMDLGTQFDAYFAFLTTLISKQGFVLSMAKKPAKFTPPEG